MQVEGFAEGLREVAGVAVGHVLQRIAVNHDHGRVHAALVGIAHFRAHQAGAGGLLAFDGRLQHTGDFGRGHFDEGRVVGRLDAGKQAVDTALFQGGNEVEFGEIKEVQLALDVFFNRVAPLFGNAVPFVYRHHQRASGFQRETGDGGVLVGNILLRVQHQYGHIGGFYCLHGFDDREFFYRFFHLAAAAHAGGVDDGEGFAVAFEVDVDTVAGGASHVEGNHALFAQNSVHQRGFAHVRAADNGEHGVFDLAVFFNGFGEVFQHFFHQVIHAVAVRTGNHVRLA